MWFNYEVTRSVIKLNKKICYHGNHPQGAVFFKMAQCGLAFFGPIGVFSPDWRFFAQLAFFARLLHGQTNSQMKNDKPTG